MNNTDKLYIVVVECLMYLFYHSKRLYLVYSVTGIAMPLSILGISWSFISSIYSMCVCVCVCVRVYVVYEDTNLYNDMGMTEVLQFEGVL